MRHNSMAAQLREAVASAPSVQETLKSEETSVASEPDQGESQPGEAETEAPAEAAAPAPEGEEAEREIEYFNDLPEAIGVSPEEFYRLKLKLSDDEEPVAWGEIKDRLQQAKTGSEELARQRADFQREVEAFRQQAGTFQQAQTQRTQRVAQAEAQVQQLAALYQAKEQEWQQRKAMEPGAVANERQELGMQAAAAQRELEAAQAEQNQQMKAYHAQNLAQQHQAIAQAIPEWSDTDKRRKLQSDMIAHVQRYGVTPQEAAQITDARTLLMIKDAMDGVKMREEAKKAVEGIKARPAGSTRGLRIKGTKARSKINVAEKVSQARQNRSKTSITEAVKAVVGDAIANR